MAGLFELVPGEGQTGQRILGDRHGQVTITQQFRLTGQGPVECRFGFWQLFHGDVEVAEIMHGLQGQRMVLTQLLFADRQRLLQIEVDDNRVPR